MDQINFNQYLPYALLLGGLILTAFACFFVSKKSNLKQTGIAVEGIVFDQGRSNDIDFNHNDKIIIRFVTKKQEWVTGPIDQDFQLFYTGQYKNGDHVKVFYNPAAPSEFYVDTKQSELITRLVGGLIGICLSTIGLYQIIA